MTQAVEEQVRALAEPLWESAARPYGMALDFWLMAEQMVLEMVAVTARVQSAMLAEPPPPRGQLPDAAPVAQIRAMAQCMWESAGRQYNMTQEFWLSAERHVLAVIRAASVGGDDAKPIEEISALSPVAYLDRIRSNAYGMWEAAGHQYGRALEFWLTAERQMLATLTAVYAPPPRGEAPPSPVANPTPEPPVATSAPAKSVKSGDPEPAKRRKRTSGMRAASPAASSAESGGQTEASDR
jgi:Protein of unknown function (DUF2934).